MLPPCLIARAQETPETVRQTLEQQYSLTKTTASMDDIVTAGAVLVLEKDGLEMSNVGASSPAQNNYNHGKITQGGMTQLMKGARKCPFGMCGSADKLGKPRTFVAGEKFWLTKVEMKDDGVVLTFFSDPIADIRYTGTLKFPYAKGTPAAPLMSSVAEVIKVQPSDTAQADPGKAAPAPAPAPAAAPAPAPAMAAIPPPPPPADAPPPEPKTVKLGQTKDEVVAMFGQPTKILNKGATKVYVYSDMKVTFNKADKVSDIE